MVKVIPVIFVRRITTSKNSKKGGFDRLLLELEVEDSDFILVELPLTTEDS